MRLHLVYTFEPTALAAWVFGDVFVVNDWRTGQLEPRSDGTAATSVMDICAGETDAAILFWDPALSLPDRAQLEALGNLTGDIFHAGLLLGLGGHPVLFDTVHPTWMLNRDPDPGVIATSWRVSLRACFVRAEVIRTHGFLDPSFETIEAAALEWGYRCVQNGALPRHVPFLLAHAPASQPIHIPVQDQLRFILRASGRKWMYWALLRGLLRADIRLARLPFLWNISSERDSRPSVTPGRADEGHGGVVGGKRVTVLIPTLQRYPWLRTVLKQLRHQTVPPYEVLVIDQTPREEREENIAGEFPDLPLTWLTLDEAGQCTSRNAGLRAASGDCILFLDDDDEIEADLLERHLRQLSVAGVDVSCGVAHEVGAGTLPAHFRRHRVSDVFPTNNSMLHRCVLERAGLFDLAYDHGQRADGDLGMRLYLSGAVMRLNPDISVLHHHAPRGGLRAHRARVITYASSRRLLLHRQLLSISEFYLTLRYFSEAQLKERMWLTVMGTFSIDGPIWKRFLKVLTAVVLLPDTLRRLRRNEHAARAMLTSYPRIPSLGRRDVSHTAERISGKD